MIKCQDDTFFLGYTEVENMHLFICQIIKMIIVKEMKS